MGLIYYYVGIEYSFLYPYSKFRERLRFELFHPEKLETVRVVEKETGELLGVLTGLTTFLMTPDTYQAYIEVAGYLLNNDEEEVRDGALVPNNVQHTS